MGKEDAYIRFTIYETYSVILIILIWKISQNHSILQHKFFI